MHKTILAAAITLLAGTGFTAAQQAPAMHEGHLDQLDTDNDGGVSQGEYQAFMSASFARIDSNGDGVLVQSEVAEVLTPEQFAAIDANGDGRVRRDEFMDRVMRDFAAADRSGDGNLN
ncbi:EF-hand domain-containing protein [Chelativorans sp. AA-79]|uniref:EF-hand domain-containing protein n=1 Tax=Chelativorans sp. AA-79 TaxID=3028735 RepID=UPI0023F99C0E|nr:EF-hand domain-containing protein [Chelativorans sp. AA-79]WEX11142.1 EF-hand domain-containing protein [Chelativorans sp. AA-79]